jgi:hypothetical protein
MPSAREGVRVVKTMLVITYLMGGHVIDTDTLDAANMDSCRETKRLALSENTPVTTRYGSNVKIFAECKQVAGLPDRNL